MFKPFWSKHLHNRPKVGICDRELRDLERDGLFPKRFTLNPNGGRAVGHLESEVDDWIAARAATRSAIG